jgi:hypothetical protein
VNGIEQQSLNRRKERIYRRLNESSAADRGRPMFRPASPHYEMADRIKAFDCGGIGAVHQFVRDLGLDRRIDERLELLQIHRPYHESDHVLNIAYNALCGGTCLEDLERRRHDEAYLDALGADRIPDPTTAGDFCRRFSPEHIRQLMEAIDETRLEVWKKQPPEFLDQAVVHVDGTIVETHGECKQGMDISYQGAWGYHPLVVSLGNTREVLRIVNRSGNRPSHEGAAREIDDVVELLSRGGFRRILVRGDTDFSQTAHLDRWDEAAGLTFLFGLDVAPGLHMLADDLPANAWRELERPPKYEVQTERRRRPTNVKEQIVNERQFKNITLDGEMVAEMEYRPAACRKSYRLVVVRKDLTVVNGQPKLYEDYRYFFYITNDRDSTAEEIVFSANDRCDHENDVDQLKNGLPALHSPVDTLESNWAYRVMTALAWNLKAWVALCTPESPRWRGRHRQEKRQVLRMEFKRFVSAFIRIPCQVLKTARRTVYRLLAWNPYLPVFSRFVSALRE